MKGKKLRVRKAIRRNSSQFVNNDNTDCSSASPDSTASRSTKSLHIYKSLKMLIKQQLSSWEFSSRSFNRHLLECCFKAKPFQHLKSRGSGRSCRAETVILSREGNKFFLHSRFLLYGSGLLYFYYRIVYGQTNNNIGSFLYRVQFVR